MQLGTIGQFFTAKMGSRHAWLVWFPGKAGPAFGLASHLIQQSSVCLRFKRDEHSPSFPECKPFASLYFSESQTRCKESINFEGGWPVLHIDLRQRWCDKLEPMHTHTCSQPFLSQFCHRKASLESEAFPARIFAKAGKGPHSQLSTHW